MPPHVQRGTYSNVALPEDHLGKSNLKLKRQRKCICVTAGDGVRLEIQQNSGQSPKLFSPQDLLRNRPELSAAAHAGLGAGGLEN